MSKVDTLIIWFFLFYEGFLKTFILIVNEGVGRTTTCVIIKLEFNLQTKNSIWKRRNDGLVFMQKLYFIITTYLQFNL